MKNSTAESAGRRRFELKKRIGAGAFGEVFLADQVSAGGFRRLVALKVLNESAARMKEASSRMRDEARILGRLSHRHIVEVLDLVQLGDRWAVVMAYVPGADLERALNLLGDQGRAIPGPAACAIGAAVARALHAAWLADDGKGGTLKVVHRDIKPSNVRITADGEVKVLDFGVARVDLEGREAMTRRPGLIGTEIYMAPERLLLEGDGPEGDVYALTATMVELLRSDALGRSPVRDEAHAKLVDDAMQSLDGKLQGPPEVVQSVLDALRAGLAADPKARPSAADLVRIFDEGARRLEGATLATVCAEVVAMSDASGDDEVRTTSGTLIEGSSPMSLPTLAPMMDDVEPVVRVPWHYYALAGLLALSGVAMLLANPGSMVSPAPTPMAAKASPVPTEAAVEAPVPAQEAPAQAVPAPELAAAVPAPPVEAVPAPKPVDAPTKRPKPVETQPAVGEVAPEPQAPLGPPVSRAMFAVADVSAIEVRCGNQTFRGTTSVRAVDFPAGTCTVHVEREGRSSSARVQVDGPREVHCTLDGGSLSCR